MCNRPAFRPTINRTIRPALLQRRCCRLLAAAGLVVGLLVGAIFEAHAQDAVVTRAPEQAGVDAKVELESDPQQAPLTAMLSDTVAIDQMPPYVLRPLIVPGSVAIRINGESVDASRYRVDTRRGQLWLSPVPDVLRDTVVAEYRVLPYAFKAVYRAPNVRELSPGDSLMAESSAARADYPAGGSPAGGAAAGAYAGRTPAAKANAWDATQLEHSGSITRGIATGNRQDMTVESGLRMHLSGAITDGVTVEAMLTDENTPIQPEGVTQRLNEFDRVFIELEGRPGTARLGDFDLAVDGGAFAPLQRKVQGASFSGTLAGLPTRALGEAELQGGAAISRGQYRMQEIQPVDGVQGPYRLSGGGGEPFIVVIAGSENVYLDGELQERGRTNDYTIDYSTGEVTFTSDNLITDDRRIRVEFQYATGAYSHTLLASEGRATFWDGPGGSDRAYLAATYLQEMDVGAFAGEGLSGGDSLLLEGAGDGQAEVSGAVRVAYEPEAPYVQYRRRVKVSSAAGQDTIYEALQQAPFDSAAVYRVDFTFVGEGQGTYERGEHTLNGLAYRFVGEGMGGYAPVRRLERPAYKRVMDFRGGVTPLRGVEMFGEWAQSVNDANRFSPLDGGDDRGSAYRAGVRLSDVSLDFGSVHLGRLAGEVSRRFTGENFSSFQRIRAIEFDRQWNLSSHGAGQVGSSGSTSMPGSASLNHSFQEQIDKASLAWRPRPDMRLEGSWGHLRREGIFDGYRRALHAETEWEVLPQASYDAEYITSTDHSQGLDGSWLRQRAHLQEGLWQGRLRPVLSFEQEDRRQRALGTDSLTATSRSFWAIRPGFEMGTGAMTGGGSVAFRKEQYPAEGTMREAAQAWTARANIRYSGGTALQTRATIGYRRRQFNDYFRREQKRESTGSLLMEWNGRSQTFGRAVDVNWYYEALTERTPIQQEIYIQAGPELGQFVWNDTDQDAVVEIGEFLPEVTPNEGTYIRSYVPSDTLTPTVSVDARADLNLSPEHLWEDPKGWQRWLAEVRSRSTIELQEKSRLSDVWRIYLLDMGSFRNPLHTLRGRLHLRQNVALFATESDYGLDLSYTDIRSLTALAAGEEALHKTHWEASGRYRPGPRWSTRLSGRYGRDQSDSEAVASRRYDIQTISIEPAVTMRAASNIQLSLRTFLAHKSAAATSLEARILRVPFTARISRLRSLTVRGHGELSWVHMDGSETPTGFSLYELTDGRGTGTSYLWGLDAEYRISDYLSASLAYDGRLPSAAPAVHTMRVKMTASF